ncbi:hypothetical protein WDW37_11385 [Bdellovibrionota bacterium FG-1]
MLSSRTREILAIALMTSVAATLLMTFSTQADDTTPEANPSVREQSKKFVQSCADKVAVGTSILVKYDWTQLCAAQPDKDHPYHQMGDSTDYVLTREPDENTKTLEKRVSVKADLLLDIISSEELNSLIKPSKWGKPPQRLKAEFRTRILETTRACMPTVNRYWNHYGVNLVFSFSERLKNQTPTANTLTVVNGAGRSNSKMFFFDGLDGEVPLPQVPSLPFVIPNIKIPAGLTRACTQTQCKPGQAKGKITDFNSDCSTACEPARTREYCNMIVHELGHRLGLPDEYAEPLCPNRPGVSQESFPYSIMAVPQAGLLDDIIPAEMRPSGDDTLEEFFTRSVTRVVGPLCGIEPIKALQ